MQTQRLPKEVLNLFPIWEYQCPKCGSHLGYEPAEYCVKCGAKFNPEQARVPPRFLKNYKAMSEYAHKVLAPKLTEKQRTLLFKYFTTLFEDDFKSGDFSAWSGISETSGADITVESTDPYHGTYHAESDIPTGTSLRSAYCYKTGFDEDTVYIRQYVKFLDALPSYTSEYLMVMYGRAGSTGIFQVGVWQQNALWGGNCRDGTTWANWNSDPATYGELNTWYCVEVGWYKHATSGWFRVWLDGDLIFEDTNRDTSAFGNLTEIRSGVYRSYMPTSGSAHRVRLDCVVVADAYIGPISEGETYEIYVDAIVKASAEKSLQTTYNIAKDAAVTSQAVEASESTFNISKDVIVKSLADLGIETTFNISKDALVQALADVVVEKVAGQLIEIFKDAVVQAQASFVLESTFNIDKDAISEATATVSTETIFNVVKDAIIKASASPQVLGVYPINVDALVQASATPSLQQTLGISKDAVVVAVSTPLIQSAFNISKNAVVKVLAEVSVVKEGEVKVTKLFLMLGNIAIQLTGD